jgi:hypothetical protein
MRAAPEEDVEQLLRPDMRARLPFSRLLALYLNPFALFKDASSGTAYARKLALSYNRAMRWVLLSYLRRWVMIAGTSFLCLAPAEALAAQESIFIIPVAAFAVGCCLAVTVIACTAASYVLLGRRE